MVTRVSPAWLAALAHRVGAVLLIVPLASCAAAPSAAETGADAVVLAWVGDRPITRADLRERILDRYYGKRALLGLVREALFLEEAERLGVTVTEVELAAAVAAELERGGRELDERLEQVGLERADLERELRAELRTVLLLERVVKPQRRIGEHQLQRLYQRTFALKRARVRHIALPFLSSGPPAPERVDEVREQAAEIAERVRAGEDFATLARELSGHPETAPRGGDMGTITEKTPIEAILRDAIFALPEHQVSDPVREGDYGFHLFWIDHRWDPRPLREVREELRRELAEAQPTDEEISAAEQILRSRIPVITFPESL